MVERTIKIESLGTTSEFIQEFRLFSEDNGAKVIDLINKSLVVLVDETTHFYLEISNWEDVESTVTHPIVLVSKIIFQNGEILENSKDGFMIFMEADREAEEWDFPIIKIVKDHDYLSDFLDNINPPQKLLRTTYR